MKYFCLALINFYQRFISPHKGFCCAHHQLHNGPTCSNAVKSILRSNSLSGALPLIQARFRACKRASDFLATQHLSLKHQADLPCDCAFDLPTPSGSASCFNDLPCDLCWDWPRMKRRTRRILGLVVLICAIAAGYFYGSQITKIEINEVSASQRNDGLVQKLISRKQPSLRVVIVSDARKIYSEIKMIDPLGNRAPVVLEFKRAISLSKASTLEIHDARFSAAKDMVVLGQVLERFDEPKNRDKGKRFAYEFRSRWGF